MVSLNLEGIFVPTITPFNLDGQFDESAYRELIDWYIAEGVDGIVPCASIGEGAYLTLYERNRILETAISQVSGRVPVVAGTIISSTNLAIQAVRVAAELGADAVLLSTPQYYPLSQADLLMHFRKIAAQSSLPIVISNNPSLTHVFLDVATIEQLASHPRIIGVKECSDRLQPLADLIERTPSGFQILAGSGQALAKGFEIGCDGAIVAISNVLPRLCHRFYDAVLLGKYDQAQLWNDLWLAVDNAIASEYGIPGLKAAMNTIGLPAGFPKPPLRPLSVSKRQVIHEMMQYCDKNFSNLSSSASQNNRIKSQKGANPHG
ncbi:dihydrodipicolinate synthase family protein [Candidatus Acetothermia bacterium]|nr:dihydrodipicolinate synthase family protein [Candidatus Acetothermia bacterium]